MRVEFVFLHLKKTEREKETNIWISNRLRKNTSCYWLLKKGKLVNLMVSLLENNQSYALVPYRVLTKSNNIQITVLKGLQVTKWSTQSRNLGCPCYLSSATLCVCSFNSLWLYDHLLLFFPRDSSLIQCTEWTGHREQAAVQSTWLLMMS